MTSRAALKVANDRLVPYAYLIYVTMATVGAISYGSFKLGEVSQKVSCESEKADLQIRAAFNETQNDCTSLFLKTAVWKLKDREKGRGAK